MSNILRKGNNRTWNSTFSHCDSSDWKEALELMINKPSSLVTHKSKLEKLIKYLINWGTINLEKKIMKF